MSNPSPARHAPQEIDAYLSALREPVRAELERIRSVIRELAPDCTERISYGIPIFRLSYDLVGLSSQSDHCALHSMSPALMKAMKADLKAQGVKVSGATIHFTPEKPLSRQLIEEIVRARIQELEVKG